MIGAAHEGQLQPGLSSNGLDRGQGKYRALKSRSLFNVKFQVAEYVIGYRGLRNFRSVQTELLYNGPN